MKTLQMMMEVFDRKQRRSLFALVFAIIVGAGVELLSLSAVLPFVESITDPSTMMEDPKIRLISDLTGVTAYESLVILMCGIIIGLFILKNCYVVFLSNFQYRFTYYGLRDLSSKMMNGYMDKSYPFFANHNSAELLKSVQTDTNMFYVTVLNGTQLMSECIVSVVLVVYLILQDPLIAISMAVVLGLMALLFIKGFRKAFKRMGEEYRVYVEDQIKCMHQSFGGIKEIKITDSEEFFKKEFWDIAAGLAKNQVKNGLYNAIPKPMMETMVIAVLLVIISLKVATGASPASFIPTISVFALAAFRLLPSVNKISGYVGVILYNKVAVEEVHRQVKAMEAVAKEKVEAGDGKVPFTKDIVLKDVVFAYEGADHNVIDHVDLSIQKNTSIGFIGPSGAGKTTIVDVILGIRKNQEGKILVDGTDIHSGLSSWHEKIGYIPQKIYLMDDTIRNNIAFAVDPAEIDDDRVWEALEEAQLKEFVESLEDGLDTMVGELGARISGGQQQRMGIARALYRRPELLVLDEATSALDNDTEKAVMEAIDSLHGKLTLIIIAHRLTTIKNCDVIYEIKDGKVEETTVDV
ncbi:MAG: ABC transporter ATP-binding protein/permease [Lachnospiraceae bacterium]|nr:ABC transporter ATP-binding protein/permease [Lachnospiraceae bacterium]